MEEKIGGVIINTQFYSGEDLYSDGDIENDLLEIVKNSDDLLDVLSKDTRWPVVYHLSDQRKNLLQVMDINKSDKVLEVGAGCGALTGGLAKRAGHVTCIELSKKRSMINAYRNSEFGNIDILVGDFNDICLQDQYDVITLIGVLEYAKCYCSEESRDPYLEFLLKIKSHLRSNGRLYIAIENKLGVKYFAGAPEDHTGVVFDGVTGYRNSSNVMTFTKKELEEMLRTAGLPNLRFYYPFPDYKFCKTIYSDEYMPKEGEIRDLDISFDRDRSVFFNENEAMDTIIRGGYFDVFSNSFLIEAMREH